MKKYNYNAISIKDIKMLKISLITSTIFLIIFAIASISLSLIGMKQSLELQQKDEQIQELTSLVENMKGE